jgi:hypothetical protein
MKAKEFEIKKRDPNWRAMQDIRRSGAGGQHKDKKKAAKQGEVKHKGQMAEGSGNNDNNDFYSGLYAELLGDVNNHSVTDMVNTKNSIKRALESGRLSLADVKSEIHQLESELKKQGVAEGSYTTEKQIKTRIRQIMYDRKLSGTESNAGELNRLKQQLKDIRSQQDVSEGGEPDEKYLDKVISDLHKDALGFRPDQEFGQEWMSSSFEEKLEIYHNLLKSLHSDMDEGIGGTIVGGVGQFFGNKIDPLAGEIMRAHGEIAGRKAEYTIRKYMHLLKQALEKQLKSGDENEDMKETQDDWGSMSHREFKRRELQHELGHEDDPEFQRQMREKDRGPWYIRIDGKIYKQKGEPKVFDWKKGANNYALAIVKNRPELKDKTVLTRNPVDQ